MQLAEMVVPTQKADSLYAFSRVGHEFLGDIARWGAKVASETRDRG